MNVLAVSVALGINGKPEDAARVREEAADIFSKSGTRDRQQIARVLNNKQAPSLTDIHQLVTDLSEKALLLVALAQKFPDQRQVFLDEAARFNVRSIAPSQLIRKALATPAKPAP